jgi:hypothetical protein
LSLQRGDLRVLLRKMLTVQTVARFPQLHRAKRYGYHAPETRSTPCLADRILGNFLRGGACQSQKPQRRSYLLGCRWITSTRRVQSKVNAK